LKRVTDRDRGRERVTEIELGRERATEIEGKSVINAGVYGRERERERERDERAKG
jgi:hypothetical protein